MAPTTSTREQLQLASLAAAGDADARAQVNALARPIIEYQSSQFCKRFCRQERFHYQCSLPAAHAASWGAAPADASLCEWGNASYGWMLDDLTSAQRLKSYRGDKNSSLYNYLYRIANSLLFYERWKDWRFGRKAYVPQYIQQLHPLAARVFLAMRSGYSVALIAQSLGEEPSQIEPLHHQISQLLAQKNKLHLLQPPETVSLSENNEDDEHSAPLDIASFDEPAEQTEEKQRLLQAWRQLSPVEQFVLEALVIENRSAEQVLSTLATLQLRLREDTPIEQTDRQQLYYFKRKTLARLAQLMQDDEKNSVDFSNTRTNRVL